MRRIIVLLMNLLVCFYSEAQQWFIEHAHKDNEDVVFITGDMSGIYNYALGYRYDKTSDKLSPYALCVNQDGDYRSKEIQYEGEDGSFNSAIGIGDENIFVTAYCTNDKDLGLYEKMWIAILDPDLDVLYENYISVERPYLTFGYTAHVVVNKNNEFVVLAMVTESVTKKVMRNCDFVFYKFDDKCNLLSTGYLGNTSHNSDVSDFVYFPNLDRYAILGRAINVTGENSVSYVDEDFNFVSCMPIDDPNNYPNYIRPYFVSVGHLYDDNSILMSMQTKNTMSDAEYCPVVIKFDEEMNVLDSIKFERYGFTDYVSQYNSIAYVDSKTIYVSSFEVEDAFVASPNTASVYLIDDDLNMLGKVAFELGYFMNILYIQPTIDGGCIIQAYYENASDKIAVIGKLDVDDFIDETVVDEYRKEIAVECYPNPVSSILNINIDNKIDRNIRVIIYDISGGRCMDNYYNTEGNVLSLDLSLLKRGVYYCNIICDDNITTEVFVKR